MKKTRIVAVRHAKPKTKDFAESKIYPLSEEGKEVQRKMSERLANKGVAPDLIFSSPLLRALETATIIAEIFHCTNVESEEALGEDFNEEYLLNKLSEESYRGKTIFLVGHMPTLPSFVEHLIGRELFANGMKKSSAAIIEFNEKIGWGLGNLVEYITPEQP